MASIQKTAKGGYRAFLHVLGQRESKTFPTKREAQAWARERENVLLDLATKPAACTYTLRQALRKYSEEVSEHKKGKRWEQLRLLAFEKYFLPLDKPLIEVLPQEIEIFRDSRLKSVSGSTVRRELNLLSSVFTSAKMDWRWGNENPCRQIRQPTVRAHRDRLIKWWEIRRMLRELGYVPGKRVASTYQAVGACFLLALRTGMRAGELCGLTWKNVHGTHAYLPDTKNGSPRRVPLSSKALKVLEQLKGWDPEMILGLSTASLDAIFRKVRKRAGLEGFTFHDSRHVAATMLARKLSVLEMCLVFGWKNPRQALTYFNPTVDELAARLG